VTGLRDGWPVVRFAVEAQKVSLLFATASISAMGPIQTSVQWVQWTLSPHVKQPEREADHSPPPPRLRMGGVHSTIHLRGVVLN
jgi:hypothetical protein